MEKLDELLRTRKSDIDWLLEHFEKDCSVARRTVTLEDMLVELVDDVLDVWLHAHGGDGN